MFNIIKERLQQKSRTITDLFKAPVFPARYRGRPFIKQELCDPHCRDCIEACPVGALFRKEQNLCLDLAKCIFCLECTMICKNQAIDFSRDYKLAVNSKQDLLITGNKSLHVKPLEKNRLKLFKNSLKLRQVCAGGCNACAADTNVLNTIGYDLGRFGIQFVASPRHADGILITGPVTKNMLIALEKTYAAIPSPKVVIAVGVCSISGGLFYDHDEVLKGIGDMMPVDLYIPGCPPHPLTILAGLLKLIRKIQ